ncbi:MAG: methionine--tRNA ligase [Gemmatimonadota bacterium]|nr:methionine--tRNA ligase [Gemmatimonadota bacterium]
MKRKFYLTTAIDYVNSKPHLGTAYEKIAADCLVRARRLAGDEVLFVMGNDEHSINVARRAEEEGLAPLAYCDRMGDEFRAAWKRLNISFDDFIRTTEPRHRSAVEEIIRRVRDRDHITTSRYKGWYCEGCEAFFTGKDLEDGVCPTHRKKARWVEEENYFFRLSHFRDRLLEHIREHPEFILPATRRNEVVSFLDAGLDDISISRAGESWGIPFPDDPGHTVYVWFDALTNYLSAVGFGSDEERCEKWWPADVHLIGKDITRFHCIIWPAMLMAAEVPLPRTVYAHGFITHSGEKMSKSLGNIVNPLDVVDITGADPLRYFLLREITFGKDGDFDWERFVSRYNADLANDLGNLVKRTVDMTAKFLNGKIPRGAGGGTSLAEVATGATAKALACYESFDLSGALSAAWELVRESNRTVQELRPWEIAKDPARGDELNAVLSDLLEAVRVVSVLASPAMPERTGLIRERLGLAGDAAPGLVDTDWRAGSGWSVNPGDPVFPRIKKDESPAPPASP